MLGMLTEEYDFLLPPHFFRRVIENRLAGRAHVRAPVDAVVASRHVTHLQPEERQRRRRLDVRCVDSRLVLGPDEPVSRRRARHRCEVTPVGSVVEQKPHVRIAHQVVVGVATEDERRAPDRRRVDDETLGLEQTLSLQPASCCCKICIQCKGKKRFISN